MSETTDVVQHNASRLWIRRLCYIIIFTLPFDIYRLDTPLFHVSLFRIVLVLSIVMMIIHIYRYGLWFRKDFFIVLSLFIIGTTVSLFFATNQLIAIPVFVKLSLSVLLIPIFVIAFKTHKEIYHCLVAPSASYFIYFSFVAFTFLYFIISGEVVTELPLADSIPLQLAGPGHLEGGFDVQVGDTRVPRVALPLTSPPHLSMVFSVGVIIPIGLILVKKGKWVNLALSILVLIAGTGLIATFSRSGWLAGTFGVAIFTLLVYIYTPYTNQLRWLLATGTVVALCVLLFVVPTDLLLKRLSIGSSVEVHIATRKNALLLTLRDWTNIVIGVGLNNYQIHVAELPGVQRAGIHSHSPYTTVLSERGIFGSILYWPLFYYPVVAALRNIHHTNVVNLKIYTITLTAATSCILFGFLLYEFNLFFNWILMGFLFAVVSAEE